MRVVVTEPQQARLENPEDLTTLSVATHLEPTALAVAIEQAGLGTFDGSHAMLEVVALRELAPEKLSADETWVAGFERMVEYAISRGWSDAEGRVRAHVDPT
jgi:hypothetical protein